MNNSTNNRAAKIIDHLKMQPHPEGGHYCRTYLADLMLKKEALPSRFSGDRALSSAIYFLLQGEQFSAIHRIKSDELWHFHEGASLNLYIISPLGEMTKRKLGSDIESGEEFQIVIPAGSWFGAKISKPNSHTLFGCTVAPGFDFADFELGTRDQLLRLFPKHAETILSLTRQP